MVKVMESMTKDMFGKGFADKGYISKKLSDLLFGNGIQLIAKPKKNMKNVNLSHEIRFYFVKGSSSNR